MQLLKLARHMTVCDDDTRLFRFSLLFHNQSDSKTTDLRVLHTDWATQNLKQALRCSKVMATMAGFNASQVANGRSSVTRQPLRLHALLPHSNHHLWELQTCISQCLSYSVELCLSTSILADSLITAMKTKGQATKSSTCIAVSLSIKIWFISTPHRVFSRQWFHTSI